MASKTDVQRINNTIAFIDHLPANVHQFAPAAAAELQKTPAQAMGIVSQSMSLGAIAPHRRAAMRDTRHARRALILIRAVLLNQSVQAVRNAVNNVADAALNTAIGQAITQWVNAEQPKLTPSFMQFENAASVFLQANKVFIDSKGLPGPVDYYWGWDALNNRYMATGESTTRNPVVVNKPVFHIPTTPYSSLVSLAQIPTLKVTRSPCITTQLTGCAYVFYVDGSGELYVTHVWPKGDIPALQLCTDLRNSGRLIVAGHPVQPQVFGACPANNGLDYKHAGTKTYVVAVGGPGNWEIHIQQQVGAGMTYWRIL